LATCFDDVLRRQVRHIHDSDYGAEFWRGVRLATCFDDVLRRQVRHINDDYGAEFATTELLGLVRLPYSALLTPQATRSPVSRLEPSSAHDNC